MSNFSDFESTAGQNGFRLLLAQIMSTQADQSRQVAANSERLTRLEERLDTLIKATTKTVEKLEAVDEKLDAVVKLEDRVSGIEGREKEQVEDDANVEAERIKQRAIIATAIITGILGLTTTLINVATAVATR